MKLINLVLSLTVLSGGLYLSHGEKLNCEFRDEGFFYVGALYSCIVESLETPNDNLIIDGYNGVHKANKTDNEVEGIWFHITKARYIPVHLGFLFNLSTLSIQSSHLNRIKAADFYGMQDLKYLNLFNNYLSFLPSNSFSLLKKLKIINLGANKIEDIPNDLFSNNLILETIDLYGNNIKYLSPNAFDGLTKLNHVNLEGNICGKKIYYGSNGIIKFKNETKDNCKIPSDVMTTQFYIEMLHKDKQRNEELEMKLLEAENGQTAFVAKNYELNKKLSEVTEKLEKKLLESEEVQTELLAKNSELNTKLVEVTERLEEKLLKAENEQIQLLATNSELNEKLSEVTKKLEKKLLEAENGQTELSAKNSELNTKLVEVTERQQNEQNQ